MATDETETPRGGDERTSPPRPPIDAKTMIQDAQRVLEFAWGTGVLDYDCQQFGELMKLLFPKHYRTNQTIERRISELRNRKANLFQLG